MKVLCKPRPTYLGVEVRCGKGEELQVSFVHFTISSSLARQLTFKGSPKGPLEVPPWWGDDWVNQCGSGLA